MYALITNFYETFSFSAKNLTIAMIQFWFLLNLTCGEGILCNSIPLHFLSRTMNNIILMNHNPY